MKLTKGKLSKLFHKKKQTMRRYKNQRKYRRASKTFRQRKPLNLHRSSMKKFVDPRKIEWIGGTDPDPETGVVESEKVPINVIDATTPQYNTDTSIIPLGSDDDANKIDTPVSTSAVAPMMSPVSDSTTINQGADVEADADADAGSESTNVTGSEQQALKTGDDVESRPITIQSEPEPKQETTLTADAIPKQIDAENVQPESSSVEGALDIIANKIAKAVVKEMRETGSTSNQDAAKAVPFAVDALVKQSQLASE